MHAECRPHMQVLPVLKGQERRDTGHGDVLYEAEMLELRDFFVIVNLGKDW